jgi:L-histidine Nalpha-methyltransferase
MTAAAAELAAGLLQAQAQVSPKYFYDGLGSALFTAITELREYYPTRTEAAVFDAHGSAIATQLRVHLGAGYTMVDLGAGDSAKAARLFAQLQPAHYVAVDISEAYLQQALTGLRQRFPGIRMTGLGLDFATRLQLPAGLVQGPALMFYPGSSIGNFNPEQALDLLRQMHTASAGGALLIGADLVKPVPVLEAAYDDELGVTAAFNLNLLRHLNTVLGSDFQPRQWQHRARFDARHSRIEMHLHARQALVVNWPGGSRAFAAGESIHTENSYKWQPADFEVLLRDAGWRGVQRWTDTQGWFGVFTAQARG